MAEEQNDTMNKMQQEIDNLNSKMKILLENKTQEQKSQQMQPQKQQYRHPQRQQQNKPFQKHCNYNEKCNKFSCPFKHGPQRKKLCRYCMKGTCTNKTNTTYIHSKKIDLQTY